MPKKTNAPAFPKATFRESDHSYWLETARLISVTQLMAKHGLGTDYSHVDSTVLKNKAARGTLIHNEIEAWIKTGEVGFTKEFQDFLDLAERLELGEMQSEVIVNNDLVAGTADLIATSPKGRVLIDIKTSLRVDKEAGAWQLSLYSRLDGRKFAKLIIFHLSDESKAIEIEPVDAAEIDGLLEAERNGDFYTKPGLVIEDDLLLQVRAAEQSFAAAVAHAKQTEEVAKTFREMLYKAMTEQNVKSYETADKALLITRVDPTTKTTLDSKRLKAEKPDVYAEFSKTSDVAGNIRITLREG